MSRGEYTMHTLERVQQLTFITITASVSEFTTNMFLNILWVTSGSGSGGVRAPWWVSSVWALSFFLLLLITYSCLEENFQALSCQSYHWVSMIPLFVSRKIKLFFTILFMCKIFSSTSVIYVLHKYVIKWNIKLRKILFIAIVGTEHMK